nr:uncharacterized protein LOC132439216 [Delphinus delphis]
MEREAPSPPKFPLCVQVAEAPVPPALARAARCFPPSSGAPRGRPQRDPPGDTCAHQRGLAALWETGAHLGRFPPLPTLPPAVPEAVSGVPEQMSSMSPIRGHRPPSRTPFLPSSKSVPNAALGAPGKLAHRGERADGRPPTTGTLPASSSPLPGYRPRRVSGAQHRAQCPGRVVRRGPRPPLSPAAPGLPGGYLSGGPAPAPAGVLGNRSRYALPREPPPSAPAEPRGGGGGHVEGGSRPLLWTPPSRRGPPPREVIPSVSPPPRLSSLRGTPASLNRL